MGNAENHVHGDTPPRVPQQAADEAQRQLIAAEHWEVLRQLLIELPATSSPTEIEQILKISGERAIAIEPLLKPEPQPHHKSAVIARSTAEHFPLPSVVPSAQITAKVIPAEPAGKISSEPRRSTSREDAMQAEKQSGSWVNNLSQRMLTTLDHKPAVSATDGKPDNQAEVAYNPKGEVDYVTYTINTPAYKKRERSH